jgi:2-polyprenyl-6-hydroxyphenyl methylase/3-demethylubiquinone-9 3-methyltransferase
MWKAMENIAEAAGENALLFISIYNNQGALTAMWKPIKRFYNLSPRFMRFLIGNGFFAVTVVWMFLDDLLNRRRVWDRYSGKNNRGMGAYHDAIDWIGGYPFEAATPEQIFRFFRDRGFVLREMVTRQGLGCNEFVFQHIITKPGA